MRVPTHQNVGELTPFEPRDGRVDALLDVAHHALAQQLVQVQRPAQELHFGQAGMRRAERPDRPRGARRGARSEKRTTHAVSAICAPAATTAPMSAR